MKFKDKRARQLDQPQTLQSDIKQEPTVSPIKLSFKNLVKIGEGRSGYVFKANFLNCNKTVALKVCDEQEIFDELLNECQIFKYLNENQFCYSPKLFDWFTYKGLFIVVTEFIEGVHIKFKDMNEITKKKCIDILKELHKLNIVHKDIKVDNFMVNNDKVWLIDFGFSKFVGKED